MSHIELNRMLCKQSPFVLKTENNTEDHLHFTWNQVAFNQQVIGLYGIKETKDCINILLDECEDLNLDETVLVMLNYKGKPVLLKRTSKYDDSFLELPELDRLPKLVPQGQYAITGACY